MMQMKDFTELINWLEAEKAACLANAGRLKDDDRRDESNLEKVRANVYDIPLTLARSARDGDRFAFLNGKLANISGVWRKAFQEAKQRGDFERETVERIKMTAADKIIKKIAQEEV
jgi:hypothetical protein